VRRGRALGYKPASGPVRPILDGRVTDYFEWMSAGRATTAAGAMQSSARLVREVLFGTGDGRLVLLLDPYEKPASRSLVGATVVLRVHAPSGEAVHRIVLGDPAGPPEGGVEVALDRVLEMSAPLATAGGSGAECRFAVEVATAAGLVQRIPGDGMVSVPSAEDDPARYDWWV
jgi:hypothetical protein